MPISQTGSNDTRKEMSDKQYSEKKSLPVIHKKLMKTESQAELLFFFPKVIFNVVYCILVKSTLSNHHLIMILEYKKIKYLCMANMWIEKVCLCSFKIHNTHIIHVSLGEGPFQTALFIMAE